jgi:hypothetical protein
VLFDLGPKENRADLFGRERELDALAESIRLRERLVVIYGVRRVGKTSILRVFLNEKKAPYILIDIRDIYFENGYVSLPVICENIINEFEGFIGKLGFETGKTFDSSAYESLTKTLKTINEWSGSKKLSFVIAFDEAQYLRLGGKTKYDGIIAWSVDNLPNITYILTGSEIGVLKDFLNYEDVKAPLYGRFRNEITVGKFAAERSREFLSKGFEEQGLKVEKAELDDAVAQIDGIAGWLTYYGYYRVVKKLPREKAMGKVYTEGSKIAMGEVERLLSKSRGRYLHLLKAMAEGIDSWAEIKRYITAKAGKISDTRFASLLDSLLKFGFIEKDGNSYRIVDPILLHGLKKLSL